MFGYGPLEYRVKAVPPVSLRSEVLAIAAQLCKEPEVFRIPVGSMSQSALPSPSPSNWVVP